MDSFFYESLPGALKDAVRKHLAENNDLSERDLVHWVCWSFGYPYINLKTSHVDLELVRLYGIDVCRKEMFLPLHRNSVVQMVASARPWVKRSLSAVVEKEYDEVRVVGVYQEDILSVIDQIEASGVVSKPKAASQKGELSVVYGWGLGKDIDLAEELIRNAWKAGASDIHVEPMEDRVAIKFRIHGMLAVQTPIEGEYRWNVIDSFKKLAGVAVSDRRSLKDASFSVKITETKTIDIRFVALPIGSTEGENLVMRLLDKDVIKRMMGALPFTGQRLEVFKQCMGRDSGLILITGPTGSGKSTTLYTALLSLDLATYNVRTVEDPVEYRIDKIMQTQVDKKNDVTTVRALRAILRADPDVILVGEIRDVETAQLAVSASNTGHLVLSTLHTNDAVSVITRMLDLGLSRQEVYENLSLAVAQRLIPTICPHCKIQVDITENIKKHFEFHEIAPPRHTSMGAGCPECKGVGIGGRKPIFQFFYMNTEMKDLIAKGADLSVIRKENKKYFKPLIQDALEAVAAGIADYELIKGIDDEYIVMDV
jgi:type II secretory ATPase GspE/PulE/Tfp pilus assembly ATPase PilB-like protein